MCKTIEKLYNNKYRLKEAKSTRITKLEKISHWIILLAFLGLSATALAAEYFFSKEAIMDSFKVSLPMVNATIAPADQFFISRIARRDTWDIHFYFGLVFAFFLTIWIGINIYKKNIKNFALKTLLLGSGLLLSVTGIWMFLRLYIHVPEETFSLLKKIHYYAYWTFIYTLISHVVIVIYKENTENSQGIISKMLNFKSISIIALVISATMSMPMNLYSSEQHNELSDLSRWVNDKDYIEGIGYLEGSKGFDIIKKQISNCPYDKCKSADVDLTQFGTKTIEIIKPDYKKAISYLVKSSDKGNALASDKLLEFLSKRIDYKSKKPNGYLVNLLKEETGLSLNEYNSLLVKVAHNGSKTNKSCFSEFFLGEAYENGIVGVNVDKDLSITHYRKAEMVCPQNNLFKMLAQGKANAANN